MSYWRMHSGKMPTMLKNLEIRSAKPFTIFKDELYYSHDGQYIFFLIVGNSEHGNGIIEKLVIVNAHDLSLPE